MVRNSSRRRRRIIPLSSSSENDNSEDDIREAPATPDPPRRSPPRHSPTNPEPRRSETSRRERLATPSSPQRDSPTASAPPPGSPIFPVSSASKVTTTAEVHQEQENAPELDDDILQILGDAPKVDTPLGDPIHKDLANRWQEILLKGLSKEMKDKISSEYLVPSNVELLLAPALNPEAKAALQDAAIKRDTNMMYRQKQLGTEISALASVANMLISNETSKQKLLKPISDACRLLCDVHFSETRTRRNFVIASVNSNLKDTLIGTSRDKFLFGENISETLKTAKTIQRSGEVLKNPPKRNVFTKDNFALKNNGNRLNFKTQQHRKTDNKLSSDNGRGRPTQRAPARGRNTRKNDRSPPPPPPRRTPYQRR
ncbi:hypothetical protein NE865_08192 [Phthorimaea operculella]|nr:hypothetical protein NE865_08192 [Phthorimaea operculella]